MMRTRYIVLSAVFFCYFNLANAQIPDWYLQEMERLVGTWEASNTAYMNEKETDDAYGLTWEWGAGKKSLLGKLYGLRNGKKTLEYWQFIQYWDEGKDKVKVVQISAFGGMGEGYMEMTDDSHSKLTQLFSYPDGTTRTTGHKTEIYKDHEISTSFHVDEGDNWTRNRKYVWYKKS